MFYFIILFALNVQEYFFTGGKRKVICVDVTLSCFVTACLLFWMRNRSGRGDNHAVKCWKYLWYLWKIFSQSGRGKFWNSWKLILKINVSKCLTVSVNAVHVIGSIVLGPAPPHPAILFSLKIWDRQAQAYWYAHTQTHNGSRATLFGDVVYVVWRVGF